MAPKRILIVRTDGIGDFVIFTAVLEEYLKIFPDHQIDLICRKDTFSLVKNIPFVRKVRTIRLWGYATKKYYLFLPYIIIRALFMKYDKVIYPLYFRRKEGDVFIRFIRAKEKIAFDNICSIGSCGSRKGWDRVYTKIIVSDKKERSEFARNIEFIEKLGWKGEPGALRTKVCMNSTAVSEYNKLADKYDLEEGKYIVICPSARLFVRCWLPEKWVELINRIIKQNSRHKILLVGARKDVIHIKKIVKKFGDDFPGNVSVVCNQVSLTGLGLLVKNAKFLVGIDSAPVHIAAAVGTPNISIIGGGQFGKGQEHGTFYPYGDLNINNIVVHKMDCFGCDWNCIYGDFRCINDISVDEVWSNYVDIAQKSLIME